ncbi:hypothetical protein [Paenibacillus lactis]|uniref:hypothetical protein n=1 Tax=Paenibacillus lactis TaxID=228574 RepID=UPI003D73193B
MKNYKFEIVRDNERFDIEVESINAFMAYELVCLMYSPLIAVHHDRQSEKETIKELLDRKFG